jgi:capsular polysaccharide biosynthesis protein
MTYVTLAEATKDVNLMIQHNVYNMKKCKKYRVLTDTDKIIDTLSEELEKDHTPN